MRCLPWEQRLLQPSIERGQSGISVDHSAALLADPAAEAAMVAILETIASVTVDCDEGVGSSDRVAFDSTFHPIIDEDYEHFLRP
jgi:hypothetical protein